MAFIALSVVDNRRKVDLKQYCRSVTMCRAVVQIMLTSAYMGYGVASLDQDAAEIHMLVDLLRHEFGAKVRHCLQQSQRAILGLEEAHNVYVPKAKESVSRVHARFVEQLYALAMPATSHCESIACRVLDKQGTR